MKILSMTATFGKLDRESLSFREGLNVVEAPNEWGKSTWSAFMIAMFYGIPTGSRTKKDFLADKERYAPWSGKPMAGRMELLWQGKSITIERSQKGKIPFGEFKAYETESGMGIPTLTGENCGQMLLGVEREVFVRAGFLRGSDLPVGEDEALRRRLNALVTTGDESAAGDQLAQKLKKLKNDCRHNKSGLIPQAEAQREQLQQKLRQLEALKEQTCQLQAQEAQLKEYVEQLQNHQATLTYEKARQTAKAAEKARATEEEAAGNLAQLEAQCAQLPIRQTAETELQRLQQLQQQWESQQAEQLPPQPQKPEAPLPFAGKEPREALKQAEGDYREYKKLCKLTSPALLSISILLLLLSVAGFLLISWYIGAGILVFSLISGGAWFAMAAQRTRKRKELENSYVNCKPEQWIPLAQRYADDMATYRNRKTEHDRLWDSHSLRRQSLHRSVELLTGGKTLAESLVYWQQVLDLRQQLAAAQRDHAQAKAHAETVGILVQTPPEPKSPDVLTLTELQTEQALRQTLQEQSRLHRQLGECQGQMAALGNRENLEGELQQVQLRLQKLEDYNAALTLAMETLNSATTELQRRFAPRISKRARELFARLTGGRYDRLLLSDDLTMEVATAEEDTTHGPLWRSDGTVDQLYLALRLAVAEALTPEAPLVLDDAFVRFDDTRLAAAMEILKDYVNQKQIILFTCQTREKKYMNETAINTTRRNRYEYH